MQIEITLKNYRCFPDTQPARIVLDRGFTALVGVNNSGKSSLLKFFFEFRPFFEQLAPSSAPDLFVSRGFDIAGVLQREEVFCRSNDRPLEVGIRVTPTEEGNQNTGELFPTELIITCPRSNNLRKISLRSDSGVFEDPASIVTEGAILKHDGKQIANLAELTRARQILIDCMYIGPFRNALNLSTNLHEQTSYFDIEVGQLFIRSWRTFQTGPNFKHREAADQLLREIGHLFGFEQLQAQASHDEKTLQLLIDGKSYNLLEVGSGLAQFIITLANIAKRKPSYILIDEPESNLHPSLQRDFLTTLNSYATEGVLFATHGYGLARTMATRIYSVQKKGKEDSQVSVFEQTPRLAELLGELNFSGYRELGFRKVLLVEGPTEVQTLQQFLRWYGKDHQVVLLPLAGSSLINAAAEPQLQEILRITPEVFALIDSEKDDSNSILAPDREAFRKVCEGLSINCHVLTRRSIENYLPDAAVKRVKGNKYSGLSPYESFEEQKRVRPMWSKSENWRIARAMTKPEVEYTDDLDRFLSQEL